MNDESIILNIYGENFLAISKKFGKVVFAGNGIRKNFSALKSSFFINYNLEKIYNSGKKILIYPSNIELESFFYNHGRQTINQLIILILSEFHTFGIECKKTWNLVKKINENNICNQDAFFIALEIIENLNGTEFSNKKIINKEEIMIYIKSQIDKKEKILLFDNIISYILEKEL